jgi:hypothetical protein
MLKLDAKPEPVEVDLYKAAVVVDMQNAFASKNGILDIAGVAVCLLHRIGITSWHFGSCLAGRS